MSCIGIVLLLLTVLTAQPAVAQLAVAQQGATQTVPAVDLDQLSPSDFSDDELDLPYYLQHFSTLANSVVMSGPNRGFIDLSVWREPERNVPEYPRVMENVLSLAFFYATDRPWNPYFNHPAVRERLEAALEFWTAQQSDDGLFSFDGKWSLTVTAFATKFIGETLRLLEYGPPISPDILQSATEANRRAIVAVLSGEELYPEAVRFSNKFTNVWGGALAYLDLHQDPALERLLENTLREIGDELQSPAGYYYEHGGADWVFNIETHHSNHTMAWHYLRGTEWGEVYADEVRRWYEWLALNAVIEPDGSGFTMNHSFETRLGFPFYRENRGTMYGETCTPLAEEVVIARAFCESREERDRRLATRRSVLGRTWPTVPPLRTETFDGYSPYLFLHRSHVEWHPTAQQKAEARALLPYRASRTFTHQRADDRNQLRVTYVRRPDYYATFSMGEQLTPRQRFGLGLVWLPRVGAVLQSQSGTDMVWGTSTSGRKVAGEQALTNGRVEIAGERVDVEPGRRDFSTGTLTISYPLGAGAEKMVAFLQDAIHIHVTQNGEFIETIPLLLGPDDRIDMSPMSATVRTGGEDILTITFDAGANASYVEQKDRVGRKRIVTLELRARDTLSYRFQFPAGR